jgi:hypothetical protein
MSQVTQIEHQSKQFVTNLAHTALQLIHDAVHNDEVQSFCD